MKKPSGKRPDKNPIVFQGMVSISEKMLALFELLKKVSRTEAPVLIRGESGTGKELVARAIYNLSARHSGPYHAVNCASLTHELVASELFGHVKGAFTGAVADRPGLFQSSDNGTVFLDEIAEVPLEVQSRLLRVLQEKTFNPVGSTKTKKVNVRVISATHRALRREVELGNFREDLMYRVRVVPIFLPRLAEREGDVEILTWRFIDEFNRQGLREITSLDKQTVEALCHYQWPGNVRELRNNIEYAFAIGDGPVLTVDELTPELRGERPIMSDVSAERDYKSLERQNIVDALSAAAGKKAVAAEALGMSRSTLWRKAKEHGIF